jgi:hypothetical protein
MAPIPAAPKAGNTARPHCSPCIGGNNQKSKRAPDQAPPIPKIKGAARATIKLTIIRMNQRFLTPVHPLSAGIFRAGLISFAIVTHHPGVQTDYPLEKLPSRLLLCAHSSAVQFFSLPLASRFPKRRLPFSGLADRALPPIAIPSEKHYKQ